LPINSVDILRNMNEFETLHEHHGSDHEDSGADHEQVKFWGAQEKTDEEIFQSYVEDLRLSPEDFNKKILDVGAGSAQFAKWAKEHGVSSNITSLEIRPGALIEKHKAVVGSAENLPFADSSFDMVVSCYSMPHATPYDYGGDSNLDLFRQKVSDILSEMLRVTTETGEIRLAGVPLGAGFDERGGVISEELERLESKYKIQIELTRMPQTDSYRYDVDGVTKTDEIFSRAYLVAIRKNSNKVGGSSWAMRMESIKTLEIQPVLTEVELTKEKNRGADCGPLSVEMLLKTDLPKSEDISLESIEKEIGKRKDIPSLPGDLCRLLVDRGYKVIYHTGVDWGRIADSDVSPEGWGSKIGTLFSQNPGLLDRIGDDEFRESARWLTENVVVDKEIDIPKLAEILSRGSRVIVSAKGGRHFIVVTGVDNDAVYFNDPAEEPVKRKMSHAEFKEYWSNETIEANRGI
jgi:ubiquinone/menaquinone biosynthesis C-methylase UbiE